MAVRQITKKGDAVLMRIAETVSLKDITSSTIASLIKDMKDTLNTEDLGVAIAAPQVGAPVRIFVVGARALGRAFGPNAEDLAFINPVITKQSKRTRVLHEGCLSVRGFWGFVPRPDKVTLSYVDEQGVSQTISASGLLAEIFAHEVDHLNGILYTDVAVEVYKDGDEPSGKYKR